jgi:excisionase family DNA binding protein
LVIMPRKGMSVDDLIPLAEAAQILKLGVSTVRQHATAGHIPGARRIGRNWVFRRGDVEKWKPARRGRPPKSEG